jgi:hypothetical protein
MSCLTKNKIQTVIFNGSSRLCFYSFTKMVLLIVVPSLTIYQKTQFRGPTLIGVSFSSISEVLTFAIFQ